MPQEKIIIKFEAQDKGLLAALNKLSTVQAKLAGSQAKVTKASKNEKQALLQVARAQQDAAATARDLIMLKKKETLAIRGVSGALTTLNPAMLRVSTNLKKQGKDWTSLGISVKVGTQALRGHKAAIALVNAQMIKLNKTQLLGVRNNRLLANSFATLRSKLLLVSFGANPGSAPTGEQHISVPLSNLVSPQLSQEVPI